MILRKNQDEFVSDLSCFGEWNDKFTVLIECGNNLPVSCPDWMLNVKDCAIEGCTSKTYFKAWLIDNKINAQGWSNSSVMRGIIASIKQMFNKVNVSELQDTDIYFHIQSGLIEHLTPMRQAALLEIISRLNALKS